MKNTYLYLFIFLLKINALQAQKPDSIAVKPEAPGIIISDTPAEIMETPKEISKDQKVEKVQVIRTDAPTVIAKKTEPQETTDEKAVRYREISLNMMSLVSRIAPFGNGIPLAGPTTLYLKKYNGRRAFRFGLSLQASPDAKLSNTIIRIGVEKRKPLNNHWAFTRATDFMWAFGSFDTPGFGREDGVQAIGVGFGYGIEYIINQNISISTESTVFLGLGSGDSVLNFKIIPPIALYMNVKLFQ